MLLSACSGSNTGSGGAGGVSGVTVGVSAGGGGGGVDGEICCALMGVAFASNRTAKIMGVRIFMFCTDRIHFAIMDVAPARAAACIILLPRWNSHKKPLPF